MPKEFSNYVIIGGAALATVIIIVVLIVVLLKKSKAYDKKIKEATSALDKVIEKKPVTASSGCAETEKIGTQKLEQTETHEAVTELLSDESANTAPLINIEQEITYIHTDEVI